MISLQAQRTITGSVMDSKDLQPIIGASVIVLKGSGSDLTSYSPSGSGTTTDIDGNFTVQLKPDEMALSVSYLGYETQSLLVGNQTSLKIQLQEI